VGGMVHGFAAAAGISIIPAKSALALATVKYAGVASHCCLGVKILLEARAVESPLETANVTLRNPVWQGIATEALNPKTALFFLSFIPQFVNHDAGHVFTQFVVLGMISVGLNTTAD